MNYKKLILKIARVIVLMISWELYMEILILVMNLCDEKLYKDKYGNTLIYDIPYKTSTGGSMK